MAATSSLTAPMGLISNFSTRTLATAGDKKAGSVGPRRIPFTPRIQQGQQNGHGLLFIPGDIEGNRQFIDVFQAEDFLEFQGDHGQRIGIVALTGIEHPGNAADIAESQLVVAVLGAAGGQDHRVLGQRFRHFGKITARLLPSVATGHDDKALDGTRFYGVHDLVGQRKNLIMGESADDFAGFELLRGLAGFRQLDDCGEIL